MFPIEYCDLTRVEEDGKEVPLYLRADAIYRVEPIQNPVDSARTNVYPERYVVPLRVVEPCDAVLADMARAIGKGRAWR